MAMDLATMAESQIVLLHIECRIGSASVKFPVICSFCIIVMLNYALILLIYFLVLMQIIRQIWSEKAVRTMATEEADTVGCARDDHLLDAFIRSLDDRTLAPPTPNISSMPSFLQISCSAELPTVRSPPFAKY